MHLLTATERLPGRVEAANFNSPGQVVIAGTPEGVGHSRKPQLWMKPGDMLEVEISQIGVLRTKIVDEK